MADDPVSNPPRSRKKPSLPAEVAPAPRHTKALINRTVTVDIYRFISDLSDIGARTGVLERGHEELRKEVRDGNTATFARITGVEAHLARQDEEQARQQEALARQYKEIMTRIDTAADTAVKKANAEWNTEHKELIALGRLISLERRHRQQQHRTLVRVAVAILGLLSSLLLLLVAGTLNRLEYVPTSAYLAFVGLIVLIVAILVVWVAMNQGPAEPDIVNGPPGAANEAV